jgi:hypothetical protein
VVVLPAAVFGAGTGTGTGVATVGTAGGTATPDNATGIVIGPPIGRSTGGTVAVDRLPTTKSVLVPALTALPAVLPAVELPLPALLVPAPSLAVLLLAVLLPSAL